MSFPWINKKNFIYSEIILDDESQSLQKWLLEELDTNLFVIKNSFNKSICLAVEKIDDRSKIVLATFQNSRDLAIRQKTWFIIENLDELQSQTEYPIINETKIASTTYKINSATTSNYIF